MERIYYDSKTGNVDRFMHKVAEMTGWEIQKIQPDTVAVHEGHLVTFTTRFGEIPDTTAGFLQQASPYILSVSSSGNRNWGQNFAIAGNKIATKYGIPLALKFELSGTNEDINEFIAIIKARRNHGNKRGREELDTAQ